MGAPLIHPTLFSKAVVTTRALAEVPIPPRKPIARSSLSEVAQKTMIKHRLYFNPPEVKRPQGMRALLAAAW